MSIVEPIPQECWDLPMVEDSPDDPIHTLIITSDTVTHIKDTITNIGKGVTVFYCSPPFFLKICTWFRIFLVKKNFFHFTSKNLSFTSCWHNQTSSGMHSREDVYLHVNEI